MFNRYGKRIDYFKAARPALGAGKKRWRDTPLFRHFIVALFGSAVAYLAFYLLRKIGL